MGRESVARLAVRHLCWTSLPVPPIVAEIVSVDPFGDRLRPGPGAGFVVLVSFLLAYGEQKMTRAERRFGEQRPLMRIGRRAEDLIAGAPSQPDP